MIGSNLGLPIGGPLKFTVSGRMRNPNTNTYTQAWFVTFLALVGWIGLLLPYAYEFWYQNRFGFAPMIGIFKLPASWFVTGLVLVTGDTFRAKTAVERAFWIVAALFWAGVVLTFLVTTFGAELLDRLHRINYYLMISSLMQAELFATVFILTPLYVMFLSAYAIRAWFLRLTHG